MLSNIRQGVFYQVNEMGQFNKKKHLQSSGHAIQFDYEIEYQPGKLNKRADAFSK
jgi:hypothetical protein